MLMLLGGVSLRTPVLLVDVALEPYVRTAAELLHPVPGDQLRASKSSWGAKPSTTATTAAPAIAAATGRATGSRGCVAASSRLGSTTAIPTFGGVAYRFAVTRT